MRKIVLIVCVFFFCQHSIVYLEENPVPEVGTLVRVRILRLGSGWHFGMFNRLRVEPPCFRVVLLHYDGTNRIKEIIAMEEIEQLQAHIVYNGSSQKAPILDTTQKWNEEDWRDIRINLLQEINRQNCYSERSSE